MQSPIGGEPRRRASACVAIAADTGTRGDRNREGEDFIMAREGTCKAENCGKPLRAKGYCERHYRKWRKGVLGKPRYRICTAEGCRKPLARQSLCVDHFAQKRKNAAEGAAAEAPAT